MIVNPIPEFTIDYLNGKSFETAKISAPFKITFMQGNPNLFTGQCDDGHYGGGKIEGEWSLAPNNSIIISGSLERHSYQETEKVSVTKFTKHKLEFRFKDNEYQIFNYLDTKGKTILTPCDTKIKNGVWYSSLGQEVNFWETGK